MSVIDDWQALEDCHYFLPSKNMNDLKCSMCQGGISFPFVVWNASPSMLFCSECCDNSEGLQADFIHAAAIVRLQRLYPGVFTLKRTRPASWKMAKVEKL